MIPTLKKPIVPHRCTPNWRSSDMWLWLGDDDSAKFLKKDSWKCVRNERDELELHLPDNNIIPVEFCPFCGQASKQKLAPNCS